MDSKPWEQMENEPNRWFQRFERFRLMGPGRSIEATWAQTEANRSKSKRPSSQWYFASQKWSWVSRADAWDKHVTQQAAAEYEAKWRAKIMGDLEVLARLSDMARGDMADLMEITPSGFTFRLLADCDGERVVNPNTKLIKKIKQKVTTFLAKSEGGEDREIIETELELYSAQEALSTLGKYHKLFVDRQEVTGKDSGPIEVTEAGLTDDERARRITALLERARTRRTGQSSGDE